MNFSELSSEAEDTEHSAAERAAAASRSTWVSVGVNLVLTATQIAVGVVAKSQGLVADGIHSLSDLIADVRKRYGVDGLYDLNRKQASGLLDDLNGRKAA